MIVSWAGYCSFIHKFCHPVPLSRDLIRLLLVLIFPTIIKLVAKVSHERDDVS